MLKNSGFALITIFLVAVLGGLNAGCAGKRQSIDVYADNQSSLIRHKTVYNQAEFEFSASLYEPTIDDLEALRAAWVQYGNAFPESKQFDEIEKEVRKSSQKVVLVALFMTAYENADLKNKSLGWAVSPVPFQIKEFQYNDEVLQKLMPLKNQWSRIFMLSYAPGTWSQAAQFTVSNPQAKVEFQLDSARSAVAR